MHRTFASVDALPLLCRAGGRGGMRRGRWLAAHFSGPSQVTALGQIPTCCFSLLMVLQTPYATLTPGFLLRTISAPRSDGMHILGSLVVILLIVVLIIL